jgi:hypothetical protein
MSPDAQIQRDLGIVLSRELRFYALSQPLMPVAHIPDFLCNFWEPAGLPFKRLAGPQIHTGALRSHQRCPDFLLRRTSHDHVCGFLSKKAA